MSDEEGLDFETDGQTSTQSWKAGNANGDKSKMFADLPHVMAFAALRREGSKKWTWLPDGTYSFL